MGSRRIGAATVAVLTGTAALAVGTATPALADPGKTINIKSLGDVLVDGVHQRVFISDPTNGKIVATDYSGTQVGSALVNNATSLALSADSSQLYATSPNGMAIFVLDTTTLTQTAKYSTGTFAPKDVTIAGDRIWFSYANGVRGNLGTIDPTTETPTIVFDRYQTGWTGVAELATASAAPNRMGVASLGMTAILDVSGDTVTTVGSVLTNQDVTDMAITPDGNRIVTVYPGDYAITMRDADNLAATQTLPIDPYPVAVDIATDGTIAEGNSAYYGDQDGYVFTSAGELVQPFNLPAGQVATHGVAWEPDGSRLFTIADNGPASAPTFAMHVYTDLKRAKSRLALDGPSSTVVPGAQVTVVGTLASTVSLPAGTSVSISRGGTVLGSATIEAGGTFTFTDTPPVADSVTYEVSYAGDQNHEPTTASISVGIARVASTLTVSGPSSAVPGAPITMTGTLTSAVSLAAGTPVSVSRGGTALSGATVDAAGSFTFTDTPPGTGTVAYEFSYAGDEAHLPAQATASVTVSRTTSTLTLAGPSSATRAKALTITGKLASPLALPTGAKVSVSRTDLEHPSGASLGTKTVAANGSFSFTDTPTAGGTVTYRVSYAGDTTHNPASATKAVAVSRTSPTLTLTNNGKVYGYGQTVSFTAHLGSTYKNRTVEIWADPSGNDQARRLLKRGTVNSAGNIAASIRLTRNTTMSAVFPGDARTAPRTVTATVGTKVSLTLKLSKPYKTAKISGTTYAYYHAKSPVTLNVSMTGASTRKVYVALERYYHGKWQTLDTQLFPADEPLGLYGTDLVGVQLRIRIAYLKGQSGDSLNANTWTPYQYVYFTK
ncbi:hypothetical protein [Actinoplanes regularis]|uniref:hypothetical protein n=1 Tax=Actinoplanes regularis TaxID=52697 RepID=UPI0024A0E25B|nr:hypothetical protein [Actinoplanes regularis]GLW30064.1 hypothetical protein Areg01_30040 [Actinoplanes regularis]